MVPINNSTIFHSFTYGDLSFLDVCEKLLEFYNKYRHTCNSIEITIGSDSQNKTDTKMVTVIVIYAEGKGGISFNLSEHVPLIESLREKLEVETGRSLLVATTLISLLENSIRYHDMYIDCPISIHADVGNSNKSKTKDLVNFVVGWVRATGFNCTIKPDSYASSSVADKISK